MAARKLSLFAVPLLLLAACAAPSDGIDLGSGSVTPGDDNAEPAVEESSSAVVTGTVSKDVMLATTARLNFRAGPSTSETVYKVLKLGQVVKALGGTPTNGFYEIEVGGKQGWAFGKYLKETTGVSDTDDQGDDDDTGAPPTSSGSSNVASTGSCGISWYGSGSRTANGERFLPDGITAAHKTLPFNTKVRVTNTSNGKSVTVRINDRGPFVASRCLDLSRGAFAAISSLGAGVLPKSSVKYEVLE